MIGASMTNLVRARAALAIVRLMDVLAFDPDQLRDRRGRWVKDPRSGARPSEGGGAGAGGSAAVKRSPSPRDFGNFTPTNDALWAQRQERLGRRTPAATPADIKRGAVIPMDGGRWAKVMQDPYTTARKRGSVQILEDGASYARDYSVSSASESVRRDAAERAWREAGGTREAFDRERDSEVVAPTPTPEAAPSTRTRAQADADSRQRYAELIGEPARMEPRSFSEVEGDIQSAPNRDEALRELDGMSPEDLRAMSDELGRGDGTKEGLVRSIRGRAPRREAVVPETVPARRSGTIAERQAERRRQRAIAETEAAQAAREPSRNPRMAKLDQRIAENERAINRPGEEHLADQRRAELEIQKKARATFGEPRPTETPAEHEARVFSRIKPAVAVVDGAKAAGWISRVTHGTDENGMPQVTVEVGNPDTHETFSTFWSTRSDGTYRLAGEPIVMRASDRGISDSGRGYGTTYSTRKLREIMAQNPAASSVAA